MHGILPVALLTMGAIRNNTHGLSEIGAHPAALALADHHDGAHARHAAGSRSPACASASPTTLLGVLLGEMFASKHGLGAMIMNAMRCCRARK